MHGRLIMKSGSLPHHYLMYYLNRTMECTEQHLIWWEFITGYGHTANSPENYTCGVSRTMAHCDTAVLPV